MIEKSTILYIVMATVVFSVLGIGILTEIRGDNGISVRNLSQNFGRIPQNEYDDQLGISRCEICPDFAEGIECENGKILVPSPDIDIDNNCYCPRPPICMD